MPPPAISGHPPPIGQESVTRRYRSRGQVARPVTSGLPQMGQPGWWLFAALVGWVAVLEGLPTPHDSVTPAARPVPRRVLVG